jgi:hypothetical protein
VSFTDRAEIDRIVAALPNQNYGLRELVQQVVSSRAFQSK